MHKCVLPFWSQRHARLLPSPAAYDEYCLCAVRPTFLQSQSLLLYAHVTTWWHPFGARQRSGRVFPRRILHKYRLHLRRAVRNMEKPRLPEALRHPYWADTKSQPFPDQPTVARELMTLHLVFLLFLHLTQGYLTTLQRVVGRLGGPFLSIPYPLLVTAAFA